MIWPSVWPLDHDDVIAALIAALTPYVNKGLLLSLFATFLLFAGGMMLFYQPRQREQTLDSGAALATICA